MTPDEIRDQLETAPGLPRQALAAAVNEAAALEPAILELVRKAAEGVYLLPRQENLLFFGLHALAAARRSGIHPALVALLRRPEQQLERLFGDAITTTMPGVLLATFDGNVDPLYEALESPDTDGTVRWILFQVLARLSWEGWAPRERLLHLLDRFDREEMAPPGDAAWMGWQDAIIRLGLTEFADRVRHGWEAGRVPYQREVDRKEWLTLLAEAAARPDDPQRFIDEGITPIEDPVASLGWLAEAPGRQDKPRRGPKDPAEAIRLSDQEKNWLDGFLISDQVPETTMNLEELDGFFSALIAGPEMVLPSEYMPKIWGTEDGEGPVFDSAEQAQYVVDLFMRHWNTIAQRLDAGFMHEPLLFPGAPETSGRPWAQGFLLGVNLRRDAWTPLARHEEASAMLVMIVALVTDKDEDGKPLTPVFRAEMVKTLPAVTAVINAFWRQQGMVLPAATPVRSHKVGRNDPCPCGSGRKYKKCCGSAAPPILH